MGGGVRKAIQAWGMVAWTPRWFLPMAGGMVAATLGQAADPAPLAVGPRAGLEISRQDQAWTMRTTGDNPHFWTTEIPAEVSLETHPILSFEYFATETVPRLRVRVPLEHGATQVTAGAIPLSEAWREFGIDLRESHRPFASGPGHRFALVLGTKPGQEIRLRNLRLRAPNETEQRTAAERARVREARKSDAQVYRDYLEAEFPVAVKSIAVGTSTIRIRGESGGAVPTEGRIGVVEMPVFQPSHQVPDLGSAKIEGLRKGGEKEDFEIEVDRFDGKRDRATSRWRIVIEGPGGTRQVASPACYPDRVDSEVPRPLEKKVVGGVKGLGGIPALTPDHEIFELGIHHATVNMVLNALLSPTPKPRWEPWAFEGRTFFLNPVLKRRFDTNIGLLTERGIVVSAILLVSNGRDEAGRPRSEMVHPEALPGGKFTMPNLAEPEGALAYRAAIHWITERYTREDEAHGRVANWIIHNEIDQSGTWTTMGDQPLARYLETYLRSARLVHHSARRFDPHARVFVSLTHHWTKQSGGPQTFVVRDILDLMAAAGSREGDFEWGVAYHPYPVSLRNPRTWEDEVTFDFETPYITPRNLEVLPRYLEKPHLRFEGRPRGILFSEQGINAPTLSPEDQALQAAGIVYTMRRVLQLPEVEAFHYHAYRDAPEAEGGLLLGLTNPDSGRKQAWEVYRAIGTDREAEFSRFAWPLLGILGPEAIEIQPVATEAR